MIDIIIEYHNEWCKDEELRTLLRSIIKYFSGNYRFVVAGCCPEWLKDVKCLKFKRLELDDIDEHRNKIRLFEMLYNSKEINEKFIFWKLDFIPFENLTEDMLNKHFVNGNLIEEDKIEAVTKECLQRNKLRTWNCEVVYPRVYEKIKVEEIFDKYIRLCGNRRYVLFDSIYFNDIKNKEIPIQYKKNNYDKQKSSY